MSNYSNLKSRIEGSEVILLDGAIGTQLQNMRAPMNNQAWAAAALETHPFTVRRMHENYIDAGVDVITTNTYSAGRHNLEPLGLSDKLEELNLRAVMLAQDARDARAKERPVYIAGSVSNFGLLAGGEPGWKEFVRTGKLMNRRSETSDAQAKSNLVEQAQILAEAGVDLLVAEATGSTEQRHWVIEACVSTGLPVWAGFKCHLDSNGDLRAGYRSEDLFESSLDTLLALGAEVVTIFHSTVEATSAALPVMQKHWDGPIGVYPDADRSDYVTTYRDDTTDTVVTPQQYVEVTKEWVNQGVQIVGGCCGFEIEYIQPLRDALPSQLSSN
jgi:S-methylmethionine-dependent homocysteine/selenocysteine methylase